MRRPTGQDHYRSKKTGKQIRQRRGMVALSAPLAKRIKRMAK